MRYLFRVLCFGEPIGVLRFIQQAGHVKMDEYASTDEIQVWDKEVTVEGNTCSIEICVLLKENADFDEIVPTTDGILYFIDPTNEFEVETFELIMGILQKLGRMIPVCLILHNSQDYSLTPVNTFAQHIWWEFDHVAIFSYGPLSRKRREIPILALADAMINNSVPINYEFIWLRLPLLVKKTNALVNKGDYRRAGINVESIARIAKKFNETNYFIYAEQSAYLFQQVKEYLHAQHVLSDVDPKMADRFREAYVDTMVRDGDTLFRDRMFAAAAQKYEAAANWANMELKDDQLSAQIYNRAIETWVSACEFQNAFRLMEQLDHQTKQDILRKIVIRITQAADYLLSIQKSAHAKSQLYLAINFYQREGLFEDLKLINGKLLEVLKIIIVDTLQNGEIALAKLTLDEFDNIVQNFEILVQPDISIEISQMVQRFIDKAEFSVVDELIPRVGDLNAQREITEQKIAKEESLVKAKKDLFANLATAAANILKLFIKEEIAFIQEQNNASFQESNAFEEQGVYNDAVSVLKSRAEWLNYARYDKIATKVNVKLLQLCLRANFMREFLKNIPNLKEEYQSEFLRINVQAVVENLNRTYTEQGIAAAKRIFEGINRFYRHAELYDGSRILSGELIEILKKEASNVIDQEGPRKSISDAIDLLKEAQEISDSLLDGDKIAHDSVFQKITQKFIDLGDMVQAEAMLQKIQDKTVYTELHEHFLAVESNRAEALTSEVKEKVEAGMTQEKISLLWSRAREVAMSKEEGLKKRTGLKRRIFQEGLDAIQEGKVNNAIIAYLNTSDAFIQRKMFEEAGLTIAIASLLDFAQGQMDEAQINLTKTIEKAKTSQPILEESFPIRIIRFVLDMYKFDQEDLAKQALVMLENLPLFPEELEVLGKVTGESYASTGVKEAKILRKTPNIRTTPAEDGVGVPAARLVHRPKPVVDVKNTRRQGKQDIASIQVELEQEMGTLRLLSLEARNASAELMRKRTALRRAFYKDALTALARGQFDEAAKAYEETAGTLLKRRDYPALGLVVVLGILALIQAEKPIRLVEDQLGIALKSLGLNEAVVRETFPMRVLSFILKAKSINLKNEIATGWKLLENLPLFEEEKQLIIRPHKF